MIEYLKRLAEVAAAGFLAGAGTYLVENGLDVTAAGLRGLAVASLLSAYGVVVKRLGEPDRPTVR